MDKFFNLSARGTTVKREIIAGITTFLAMAYILSVNPGMLGSIPGMSAGGVFTATALASALATLVMALAANLPIALAPGMGLNAFFTYTVVGSMGYSWQIALTAVFGEMERFQEEYRVMDDNEEFGRLYLDIRHFLAMYEQMDVSYRIYTEPVSRESFLLRLFCASPAASLAQCLEKGNSTVFFSATLLPVNYYKELLCGNTEEYAVYVPSPFDPAKRLLAVGRDVSSRYKRRDSREYAKIAGYIRTAAEARKGNYLAYFPSYAYLEEVYQVLKEQETDILDFIRENVDVTGL